MTVVALLNAHMIKWQFIHVSNKGWRSIVDADKPECVDPWIKDDTLKICKNINDLRESLFAIFRKPPLRNSLDGFYGSVESNIWQGDEEQHLYKNAVFQNFPTWWTRCTRRIYMALSSFHEGEPATTDQIAKWVGCSQQQAIESVQSMLEARCVTVVDGAIREIV